MTQTATQRKFAVELIRRHDANEVRPEKEANRDYPKSITRPFCRSRDERASCSFSRCGDYKSSVQRRWCTVTFPQLLRHDLRVISWHFFSGGINEGSAYCFVSERTRCGAGSSRSSGAAH